jgi:hypothetical protein
MRLLASLFGAGILVAGAWPAAGTEFGGVPPKGPLNTLADVHDAIRGCWKWPPASEIRTGMELTIRLSFKRNGEIFGARISYQSRDVSPAERALYHGALLDALRLCSPLPISKSLGHAIAGRVFAFRFSDTRKQRKAEIQWPVPKTR